jgi:hypothetical protein
VADARPGKLYTLRVEHADGSPFAVGAYRLRVQPDNPDVTQDMLDRAQERLNDPDRSAGDATAATPMQLVSGSTSGHVDYLADGSLDGNADVDLYRLRAPQVSDGQQQSMTITLSTDDPSAPPPNLTVYDAQLQVVAVTLLKDANGELALRADNVRSAEQYYLAVQASTGGPVGPYHLSAQFGVPGSDLTTVMNGTITNDTLSDSRAFQLPQSSLVTFAFSVNAAGATVGEGMAVVLRDSSGTALWQGQVFVGDQPLRVTLLLPATGLGPTDGLQFDFFGASADLSPLANLNYTVQATVLNDPIGPKLLNPDAPPPPRDLTPTWLDTGLFLISSYVDPYGRPPVVIKQL